MKDMTCRRGVGLFSRGGGQVWAYLLTYSSLWVCSVLVTVCPLQTPCSNIRMSRSALGHRTPQVYFNFRLCGRISWSASICFGHWGKESVGAVNWPRSWWVRMQGRMPDSPGRPKHIGRVPWECLIENPVRMVFNTYLWENFDHVSGVAGDMKSEWVMSCAAIAKAAVQSCSYSNYWC